MSILALYFKETKKSLVVSGTNRNTVQALFGDDATAGLGKRLQLWPTWMRVASRGFVAIRLKAAPASNGTGTKAPTGEGLKVNTPAADNGTEPRPEAMGSS